MSNLERHIKYLKSLKKPTIRIAGAITVIMVMLAVLNAKFILQSMPENVFARDLIWMLPLTLIFIVWLIANLRNNKINRDIDEKSIIQICPVPEISFKMLGKNKKWDIISFDDKRLFVEHKKFAIPKDHNQLIIYYGKNSSIVTDVLENGKSLRK